MQLALVIYKYFPYGGLQRDMARIGGELTSRGHSVRIYCMSWQGESLPGADIRVLKPSGFRSGARNTHFQQRLKQALAAEPVDGVIGFNKMSGLDVYFAGDPCFQAQADARRSLYKRGGRYKHFAAAEQAVFAPGSATRTLLLTSRQGEEFQQHYNTPDSALYVLPPGVDRSRCAPEDGLALVERRKRKRAELGLAEHELTLLLVGSGYRTKGLDRAITALAELAREQPGVQARLLVVGQDKQRQFQRAAQREGVGKQVQFLGGRDDIPDLLLAADILLHPARAEAAGVVLLEAVVAGLPVVTTAVCGYAPHVRAARAGFVLDEPFSQADLNRAVMRCIDGVFRADCRESALLYARQNDLYSLPQAAATQIEQWLSQP